MLTRRGAAILVLLGLTYVIGDLVGLRMLYLLFVAMVLVFLLSYVQIRRAPRHLSSSRELGPNPCLEGSLVMVKTSVAVRGRIPGILMAMRDLTPSALRLDEPPRLSSPIGGYARSEYGLKPGKRGIYAVGPVLASVTDTFGLMARTCRIGEGSPLVVYPRHLPIQIIHGREASEMLGASTTGEKGTSADFLRIRAFQPGDELKMIHWRSSAKLGRLMVREFEREETRSVTILLNCEEFPNRGPEDIFETGVRVAASIAVSALRENTEVRMILYGERADVVDRGRGIVQYHRVLSALATVQPYGATPLWSILQALGRDRSARGALFIISPTIGDRDVESTTHLLRLGIVPSLILTKKPEPETTEMLASRRITSLGARMGIAQLREKDKVVVSWAP